MRDETRRNRACNSINASIDKHIAANGIDAPPPSVYTPVWAPPEERTRLDLAAAGIGSVVWCIGFAPDFAWVDAPVFNGRGEAVHQRGVARDAEFLAGEIARHEAVAGGGAELRRAA